MSTCPTCRAPVPEDATFCARCGVRLAEATEAPTATSVPGAPAGGTGGATREAVPMSVAGVRTSSSGTVRFLPGQMVAGRYRVIGLLGRGGMGEVYRADDLKLGQPVALKFLPKELERNPDRLERFLNEVRTARQVAHPNVCRVYDIGEVEGQHYLSMEYVDGEDLATLLRRIGYIPADKAVQIARQLCAGLAAAHALGFLHRDLKPANIMLDGNGRVRITDFGLAGAASSFAGAEIRAGTPAYMAPEQISGESVSVRSDVYALGLVLYEMCTGEPAFRADDPTEIARLQRESTPANPTTLVQSMDPALERVILRCLEKDPSRRPATALEVAASLPGGDPLAAALAAGETPSPQMVAAAGGVGALRPAVAGLLFAIGAVTLVTLAAVVPDRFLLVSRLDPPSSAYEMRVRAADVARDLGWTDPPVDRVGRYGGDQRWIQDRQSTSDAPDRWDGLEDVRPAPLRFWYRASPESLAPSNSASNVSRTDPPETVPGMVRVELDPQGRLTQFVGITDARARGQTPGPEPDWAPVFEATGLDPGRAEAIDPAILPRTGAGVRRAWRVPWTDRPEETVRLEAASWNGRVTYVDVIPEWVERRSLVDRDEDATPASAAAAQRNQTIAQTVSLTVLVVILSGGVFLARRNIRLGRGDRRGASRFAAALFGLNLLYWALTADHVASLAGVGMLFNGLAYATMIAAIGWMVYVALEPYVRRIWPDAIITWSRLLEGRIRDPLVGRDVLIGCVGGLLVVGVLELVNWTDVWTGTTPAAPSAGQIVLLNGPRFAFGILGNMAFNALIASVGVLFLSVLLSMLFRNRWVAAGVVWLVFTGTQTLALMQIQSPLTSLLVSGVLWGAILFLLLRRGVVASLALFTTANAFSLGGRAVDFSAWWSPTALIVPAAVFLVLAWSAWTATAGRALLLDPLAPAEPRTPGSGSTGTSA